MDKRKVRLVYHALNHCLNNDARLIFIFRENIGLPYRQIGEIMELKESKVRANL
jgi:RNA polymerase sigma-70 factor (ECF subfamily)